MLKEFLEKHAVSKLYAYHEVPRDETTVEFGWRDADEISLDGPVVISRAIDIENADSAVSLADYDTYFNKLTSLTPTEFIEKWAPSPKELEVFWRSNYPHTEEGLHEFIMDLAYLIRDKRPFEYQFERYKASFEVVEVESEQAGDET